MKKMYEIGKKLALFLFLFGIATQNNYGQLTLGISQTNVTCNGLNDGSITATVGGGTLPYAYNWTGPSGFSGQGTGSVTGPAGTYTLEVTDNTSPTPLLISSGNIVVTEPAALTVTTQIIKQFECGVGNGGAFNVVFTGGTNPVETITLGAVPVSPTSRYVNFNYTGIATTNYQLRITVPWSTGMPNDFERVWFTSTDGTPLLYWRESANPGVEAVYWVLLPTLSNGNNTLYIYWNDALTYALDDNYDFTRVFNQGGLNVTVFANTDFTGAETQCTDVNNLTVLNKVWIGGSIDLPECFSGYDTDGLSIRWEGWFIPPTGATWYGVMTNGLASNGVSLDLGGSIVITSNFFYPINQTFTGDNKLGYPAIRYDYYHTGGTDNGYARLGSSNAEPDDFDDLTVLPRGNYYYRNVVANPPTLFTFGNQYTGLAAGTYTLGISDGTCDVSGVSITDPVISTDNDDPVLSDLPPDCQITDLATFNSGNLQDVVLLNETFNDLAGWNDNNTHDRIYADPLPPDGLVYQASVSTAYTDFVSYNIPNVSFYKNITIELSASQSGLLTDWDSNDALRLGYSTDGGTNWTDFAPATGYVSGGISLSHEIPDPASGTFSTLLVRIYFSTQAAGAARYYKVGNFTVEADEAVHLISPAACGGEPTCTDNTGCTVSYSDGAIIWQCYDDATPANNEFSFNRTWTATDPCGKTDIHVQRISVGTPPELNMAANGPLAFDFCHNSVDVEAPTATDACSDGAGEIIITYSVSNQLGEVLAGGTGTGDINDLLLAFSTLSDTPYTATWTATDQAGLTDTETQTLTIYREISATVTANAADLSNLCVNENIVFTVAPVGGTGNYNAFVFNPSGGTWNSGAREYTISWAAAVNNATLSVVITDGDNGGVSGGCDSPAQVSEEFIVHRLLQTGTITRE